MGRLISLLLWFVGLIVSVAVVAWWLNTIVVGLAVRWAQWHRPLREGPLWACFMVLGIIWVLCASLTWLLVLAVFDLLRSLPDGWWDAVPDWAKPTGHLVVVVAIWLAVGAGMLAGLSKVVEAWGAARRRRFLVDRSTPLQSVQIADRAGQGRRIVILCDGTSNRPDDKPDGESIATNVWKLSRALCNDETQIVWYQAGVGSDTSSTAQQARRTQRLLSLTGAAAGTKLAARGSTLIKLVESGTGVGITEMILNGYAEIVRHYQPGDRVYLVGFSRGAFAARCIAGVISRCGLLRAEYLNYAADVVELYRTRPDPKDKVPLRSDMSYPPVGAAGEGVLPVEIEFVGVFDTVASLGFPLWGWWFRAFPIWKNKLYVTDPGEACRNVYHALSMDERRSQFFPTLFTKPDRSNCHQVLEQVWFRGNHGDVGGGYARHDASDIPLKWMMEAMNRHGLSFRPTTDAGRDPNPLAILHDELVRAPTWGIFGTWPRWHPVPGPDADRQGSKLHPTVLERARTVMEKTGRPDLHPLETGESLEFVVDTRRDWYRTGVIVENEACYRIEYLGGLTRDAECPPCGPDGQDAGTWDARRFLGYGRRLPSQKWMLLGATVAHPRHWRPKEKPFSKALAYLFYSAPKQLLAQIAPIGRHLTKSGSCVYLHSKAPSGLLYLFVNDWWQTAANNSGGPRLRIERVSAPDSRWPLLSLRPNGKHWSWDCETADRGAPEPIADLSSDAARN